MALIVWAWGFGEHVGLLQNSARTISLQQTYDLVQHSSNSSVVSNGVTTVVHLVNHV